MPKWYTKNIDNNFLNLIIKKKFDIFLINT